MKGIGVSPGISIGKARIIKKTKAAASVIELKTESDRKAECDKFDNAVLLSVDEIESVKENKDLALSKNEIEILDTQIEFLTDDQIKSGVHDIINKNNKPAGEALNEVISSGEAMFRNMEDEYLRARAADLRDIGNRIFKNLNSSEKHNPIIFPENTILIADDISPSDTIAIDIKKIVGFATMSGGRTSHTAIIAKSKGIPAVVACGDSLLEINDNDIVILDGSSGYVIVRPDLKTIEEYKLKQLRIASELSFMKSLKNLPALTTDGHRINLFANISDDIDLETVIDNGGEGVGLFRTELLFLGRTSFPSEDEQFESYKKVAIKSGNKPVIVRTLDAGGDKKLPYLGIPDEANPFLGYRAIRICLDQKELFISQLKAILRAGVYGNLKIMFPMICSVDEVRQAKQCLSTAKDELMESGAKFDNNIELGIMIEIPGAALMIDLFSKEVDFFSIGTNDLCQYTLAVDRMNEKVSGLYNHFNPGLLRLIKNVIEQAHKYNKHVAMCGEMASDPLATLLLVGMGLNDFSMNASSIPLIKNIIIKNSMAKAREIFESVMLMDTSESITKYLQEAAL